MDTSLQSHFGVTFLLQKKVTQLPRILCNVFWDSPAQAGRLDRMTHCGLFQTDLFCDSVIWDFIE